MAVSVLNIPPNSFTRQTATSTAMPAVVISDTVITDVVITDIVLYQVNSDLISDSDGCTHYLRACSTSSTISVMTLSATTISATTVPVRTSQDCGPSACSTSDGFSTPKV
jgi:hypothetical protein